MELISTMIWNLPERVFQGEGRGVNGNMNVGKSAPY